MRRPAAALMLSLIAGGISDRAGAAPPEAEGVDRRPTAEGRHIEELLDEWRFAEGRAALAMLVQRQPDSTEGLYLEGYARFLEGDFTGALERLGTSHDRAPGDRDVLSLRALAEAAREAVQGHREERSSHFVIRYPPEDEVLVPYALEALESAHAALKADLGWTPEQPVRVDVYRSPLDLAAVSLLTKEEVQATGTIALCKWARLMVTSPRALIHGYPWLDTMAHELIHYAVSSLSRDRAPVWFQEGLAKFLERRWREAPGGPLPPSMEHLLARALGRGKLISFDAMHPSMAKLPSSEHAALAFAEVATAIEHLHARGGMEALRKAVHRIRDGADAREAVAQAAGGSWEEFERGWRAHMAAQKYRTFPGMDPVTPRFRKPGALASRRKPSEDEDLAQALKRDPAWRYMLLGNMLLRRGRARAAAIEYEKAARSTQQAGWRIAVKLGRTYLVLGEPERALKAVGEAHTLYPELPGPSLVAGQALLAQGEMDRAARALEASLATNPLDPLVHCALADTYERMGSDKRPPPAALERERRFCRELAD